MDDPAARRAGALPEPPAAEAAGATGAAPAPLRDGFVSLEGETCYRISASHRLPPFLMSIASDVDLWMFVSSAGGLTAGRTDADGSLFPYETVDKLHDAHHHTGPITLVRVRADDGRETLWEPFAADPAEDPRIERNLYKNTLGSQIFFEEIHHGLGLAFRYRWAASDAFGWVRTARLANIGARPVAAHLLDGLRNLLPHGAPLALYQRASCLVDAYKRTDCDPETRLGIFSLTSRIVDRAEAAEQLRANTVWGHGLDAFDVCLSLGAVEAFRRGEPLAGESVLTGRRGNYLVLSSLALAPGESMRWHLAADVGRSHVEIAALRARLLAGGDLGREIEEALREAGDDLTRNVGSADGLQLGGDAGMTAHHLANVLFNNMRGGVFARNDTVFTADLAEFLAVRNPAVAARHTALLAAWPEEIPAARLWEAAAETGDAEFRRLSYEYLPIHFGRRHGDPSRPWNRFAIHVRNPDGSRTLRYEGNWRDLFQNWEALGLSFPGFLRGFVSRFVNASTVDGFNPYHITRDGFDWEAPDPEHPWNHIGYWGDHQIIYLLKFLEWLSRYSPGALEEMLFQEIFSYADVPYRLKPYEQMLANPQATIVYDTARASRIAERVAARGADGKLVVARDGSVYHVSLLEKLLVPALSKLSNLVPGGGIWMNTQRPEWNDANNALVGHGVSVVTLCYLRRYLSFLERLVEGPGGSAGSLSAEVAAWLEEVHAALTEALPGLAAPSLSDRDRKRLLDSLGRAFSRYREGVYRDGFSGKREVPLAAIAELCRAALAHLDHAIRVNRRPDGLYHSYSLLAVGADGRTAALQHLQEMLEGQVAALSSGLVGPEEALRLVDTLFQSRLYRPDQRSFLLYPEKKLPAFLEKNVIPEEQVRSVGLLRDLTAAGEHSILQRDAFGTCRFHGDFRNAADLGAALDALADRDPWREGVARDREAVLEVFERVFRHRSFTGRSGTMYAYEGMGCIYWHMVSKLLLAVQEVALGAARDGQPAAVVEALAVAYYRIRAGLGFEKTAAEYGAFPTDPYSHTPAHAGAQQPGMTGQVKEGILARFGELGVTVAEGRVGFRPLLLRRHEFLREPAVFRYHDLAGEARTVEVPAGAMAFTFCQVPVLYMLTRGDAWTRVIRRDGTQSAAAGERLDVRTSRALFDREGGISRIEVGVAESALLRR